MHIAIKKCKLQVQMSKPGQTHSTAPLVHTFYCKSHDISTQLTSSESSRTIGQSHHQHIGEEVWGVTMVVHALTWTLSSWFGRPLNA